ncbi:MAG: ABC transporter ATP-binding protein [Spirochaetes bacterium]|nr:ABC transporter ATP-binding protein [Spirochaetota bacterium]
MENKDKPFIEIKNLSVSFHLDEGILKAVNKVNFNIEKGKTLGLVGESGCGKSVTSQAIMRLVPSPGKITGEINLYQNDQQSINLVDLDNKGKQIRAIRGKDIAMIFQEPMTSFSALYTMGNQLMEPILLHRTKDKKAARKIAVEMMEKVGIANAEKRIDEYPYEFSGGMRQRVMIAMALSCNPGLLIADEPTTALDVTIQAQVLELMKRLQEEFGMAILFITHDLGVVAEVCDEVAVMYLGKIVEYTTVDAIFYNPLHPYTQGLLKSIPKIGKDAKKQLDSIKGVVPIPLDLKPMCGFYERCPDQIAGLCDCYDVPLVEISKNHKVRCFKYKEVQDFFNKDQKRTNHKEEQL